MTPYCTGTTFTRSQFPWSASSCTWITCCTAPSWSLEWSLISSVHNSSQYAKACDRSTGTIEWTIACMWTFESQSRSSASIRRLLNFVLLISRVFEKEQWKNTYKDAMIQPWRHKRVDWLEQVRAYRFPCIEVVCRKTFIFGYRWSVFRS